MKTLDHIPTGKFKRTGKLLKTGAKLGNNYLRYYGFKAWTDGDKARETLNKDNARDIYDGLKELKGSALKVAQMLSMEKNIMPEAFVEKFSLAQFSVPPLSGALVKKTFRKYFGKNPEEIFDEFSFEATNAASIGQVHKARIKGKELAVKIQYPGVKDSISNDLKMVKPIAMRMFNIKKAGSKKYFGEVEEKLLEETDYVLELKRSQKFAGDCQNLPDLKFPHYYPEYSCEKIISMDWMDGRHFSEFINQMKDQEVLNKIGQNLWDFYMYQLHLLKKLHADPHPGNFLISDDHQLVVIDFGCVKNLPESFYIPYFQLISGRALEDSSFFEEKLYELEFLYPEDSQQEKDFLKTLLYEILELLSRPFHKETFDFSDDQFFQNIANLSQRYMKLSEMRSLDANRGSKHFIYVNRTLLGLYNLMHDLKAEGVKINNFQEFTKKA